MKIDFSTIPQDVVEDWKHHPGTAHLMGQLLEAERHWLKRMVADSISSAFPVTTAGHGGRCAELRQVIEDIKDAKGAKSE